GRTAARMEFTVAVVGVIAAKENAANALAGKAVDPRHGVFEAVVTRVAELQESLQRAEGDGVTGHPRTTDALQLDVRPGNHTCQAKSADGGAKQVGVLSRTAAQQSTVRTVQSNLLNVSAESAGTVMVLSVHVVCDRAADGHKARAGCDGRKPAFREEHLNKIPQTHAALTADHPRRLVETENAVQATAINQLAAAVEAGVAIAAS